MKNQVKYLLFALALCSTLDLQLSPAFAQGTAFTYQGQLQDNGSPASGNYDLQFMLFPLPIGIKARYLVVVYALISVAMLFGEQRMYAFAQLGGALAGLLWIRIAPRRGVSFVLSESWYGMRNRYYRWKRRRAARKFEVYMRRQGRTVRFDGQGRQIDEDHDDKKRWN